MRMNFDLNNYEKIGVYEQINYNGLKDETNQSDEYIEIHNQKH